MGRHGTFEHIRAMCKHGATMGKPMRSNAMHNGTPELPGAMSKASWTRFMAAAGPLGYSERCAMMGLTKDGLQGPICLGWRASRMLVDHAEPFGFIWPCIYKKTLRHIPKQVLASCMLRSLLYSMCYTLRHPPSDHLIQTAVALKAPWYPQVTILRPS